MVKHNRVVVEVGKKKSFASAIDWPGWCRAGKTEEEALATLAEYADRYENVAARAGVRGVRATADGFEILERLDGSATTDFGAPDKAAAVESEFVSDAECERRLSLVRACWDEFDAVAGRVSEQLQKGPRGGGRDRDKMIAHTLESERSYCRNLGIKNAPGDLESRDGLEAHRHAILEAIREHNANKQSAKAWPLWYFVRRMSWHVLDHAWEMEDKDLTGKDQA